MAEVNAEVKIVADADQARSALEQAGELVVLESRQVSVADQALGAAVLLFVVAAVIGAVGVLLVAGLGAALICVAVFALAGAAWCMHVVASHGGRA